MKIIIQGKEVGLLFGYSSFKSFMSGLYQFPGKYQVEDKDGKLMFTTLGISKMIIAGYENYCIVKEKDIEITIDEVQKWLDTVMIQESGKEQLAAIVEEWAKSTTVKDFIEEVNTLQKKSLVSELTLLESNLLATES